jgi:hypothetical protein
MKLNKLIKLSVVAVAATLLTIGNQAWAATCAVPSGSHPTIQSAVIDASCSEIDVAPGTYMENVLINRQLILSGAGNTTIIHPTAPGPGITLSSGGTTAVNRTVIEKLMVTGALGGGNTGSGISFVNGSGPIGFVTIDLVTSTANSGNGLVINGTMAINDLVISQTSLTNNGLDGFRIPTSMASLDGLMITASHFDNNTFAGWEAYTTQSAGPLKNVMVTGTSFDDNGNKGMYLERLSSAEFSGIQVMRSGISGSNAAGIDINLKYASFQDITIKGSTISNSGTGDVVKGAGMAIKARNDAPTYSTRPATLVGVTISNNEIKANQTGVRFGEPGKNNSGPTGVAVHYNNITGNVLLGIDNQTASVTSAECNWWGSADGPGPVGTGHGDRVGINVTFQPWLVAQAPDGACIGGNVATAKNQCKEDGWMTSTRADGSTFKNQGDCIQYVNTGK